MAAVPKSFNMAIFEREHQSADAAALHSGDHQSADAAALHSGDHQDVGDNLQEFRVAFSSTAKDNSRFISETSRQDEQAKIAELFGKFDLNGDGYIDKKETIKADKTPHKVDGADPHLFAAFLERSL